MRLPLLPRGYICSEPAADDPIVKHNLPMRFYHYKEKLLIGAATGMHTRTFCRQYVPAGKKPSDIYNNKEMTFANAGNGWIDIWLARMDLQQASDKDIKKVIKTMCHGVVLFRAHMDAIFANDHNE